MLPMLDSIETMVFWHSVWLVSILQHLPFTSSGSDGTPCPAALVPAILIHPTVRPCPRCRPGGGHEVRRRGQGDGRHEGTARAGNTHSAGARSPAAWETGDLLGRVFEMPLDVFIVVLGVEPPSRTRLLGLPARSACCTSSTRPDLGLGGWGRVLPSDPRPL